MLPFLWPSKAFQPQIYAGGMAAIVAVFRVIYGGGSRRKMVLEAVICGLIGSSLIPLLEYFTLPADLATFAGCMVGFVGVEKLRDYSDRFMSRKAES
ncbi:phage holin, lambda family [Pseudomonas sp. Fl4BN1]|nr:phage holin, lambda family [Pseudomonas sp. Fl4BN1]